MAKRIRRRSVGLAAATSRPTEQRGQTPLSNLQVCDPPLRATLNNGVRLDFVMGADATSAGL